MSSALIGATGFVGTTLLRQRDFDACFHSRNVEQLGELEFDLVVCAGAPAQKWLANRDPAADRARLEPLFAALRRLRSDYFVLISTVDVFARPVAVDEESAPDAAGSLAYGVHRLELERLVMERFPRALIVRLAGLVGPGLRKNAIFDLHHGNNVAAVDSRGTFQFYPVVRLWPDIALALEAGLRVVHLTAAPLTVADVAREAFGREFCNELDAPPAVYDVRSRHARLFGGEGAYQYSRRESLLAVRAFVQSEPVRPARS